MTRVKKRSLAAGLAGGFALAAQLAAAEGDAVWSTTTNGQAGCFNVMTIGGPRVVFDCPPDEPYNFCFTREITDVAGLLSGTLSVFVDPSFSSQSEVAERPGLSVYHTVLEWETGEGTLTIEEAGLSSSHSGDYAGLGTVMRGTGRFEGAAGSLISSGNGNTGGLTSGTICLN